MPFTYSVLTGQRCEISVSSCCSSEAFSDFGSCCHFVIRLLKRFRRWVSSEAGRPAAVIWLVSGSTCTNCPLPGGYSTGVVRRDSMVLAMSIACGAMARTTGFGSVLIAAARRYIDMKSGWGGAAGPPGVETFEATTYLPWLSAP